MFLNRLKTKNGQNTAEYAILIALVIAGVIAMQTYAQRSLQGKMKDTADWMPQVAATDEVVDPVAIFGAVANDLQYEPYYLESDYDTGRQDREVVKLDTDIVARAEQSARTREGIQRSLGGANVIIDSPAVAGRTEVPAGN